MDDRKVNVELTLDELDGIRVILTESLDRITEYIENSMNGPREYWQEEFKFYSELLQKIRTIQNETENEEE